MPNKAANKTGIILMTYGSATRAEHVAEYMRHIYKDKVPKGVVEDFEERYRLVGGSPLVAITKEQAAELEKALHADGDSQGYIVEAGMLHSEPFIDEAVARCRAAGAKKLIGIVLSPQFSSIIMHGYTMALQQAAKKHGFFKKDVTVADPWPTEPHFVQLLAERTQESLQKLYAEHGAYMPVVFTTHSLPKRVVEKDPDYLGQLRSTVEAVTKKLNNFDLEWYMAYQSAGHTPEEWLTPDLVDILAKLRDNKQPAVLIVPIQFLADHLEILYDLDIAASEQCQEYGIAYNRIELPNTAPLFIQTLAAIVG